MTVLRSVLEQYASESDLHVPARLQQLATNTEQEFGELEEKGEVRCNTIRDTLVSWAEFQSTSKDLSECLRSSWTEFKQLQRVGAFAMEFSSLEFRLKVCFPIEVVFIYCRAQNQSGLHNPKWKLPKMKLKNSMLACGTYS